MSALRRLRNFWILWVTAMVLACFSNAVAQARYKVQDLGVQHPDNLGMAMAPIETVKGFQVGFITRKLLKIWRREWESNSVKNVVSTA
jgi:hypothetical protein